MYSTYSNWNSLVFMEKWNNRSATRSGEFRNRTIYMLLLFCRSVVANSLWPHGLQHTGLPCSSVSPRVCSDSCPLSPWCYLTISSSAILFSSCLQSFPASGSFPMSGLFTSGGQSVEVSTLASVLSVNIQSWFPLRLTGFILQSKGLSRVFFNTTGQKHQFFWAQASLWSGSHSHTWLQYMHWTLQIITVAFDTREESISYSVNDFVPMAILLGEKVNYLNYNIHKNELRVA